jgi:hypothetical protein
MLRRTPAGSILRSASSWPKKSNGDLLRFAGDGHIMVFAHSGAGTTIFTAN